MLKFLFGPNRNASFPDTPFLYDHIWFYVELSSPCLPPQFTMLTIVKLVTVKFKFFFKISIFSKMLMTQTQY